MVRGVPEISETCAHIFVSSSTVNPIAQVPFTFAFKDFDEELGFLPKIKAIRYIEMPRFCSSVARAVIQIYYNN